jgi:hypothetical protein
MNIMTAAAIRQQLHNYLEIAEERKLKAIYIMVEEDLKEHASTYSREMKAELDRRVEHYLGGGKMVSPTQMNKKLQLLRKKRK